MTSRLNRDTLSGTVLLAFLAVLLILLAALLVGAESAPHTRQPELKIDCWIVYYSAATKNCRQTTWNKAPSDDVQAVVLYYVQTYRTFSEGEWRTEHYRHICIFADYYWLDGCGSADEAMAYKGKNSVKTGRWTSDANFRRIYSRAQRALKPPQ